MVSHFNADQVETPLVEVGNQHGHAYFRQLKTKLRWLLLVVFITPLIMLSVYFHFQYSATLRKGIDNHLISIAENQRNTVDLFLQERVANLRNVFHPEGLAVLSNEAEIEKRLAELRRESQAFVDLGLFRPDGTLISYAGPFPSLVGKSYAKEKWFEALNKNDRGYFISDVYLGFRGKPHFIVAVRQNVDGQIWALRASVDPEKFGDFVGGSCLIKEAEAFIVNAKGQHQTFFACDGQNQPTSVPPRVTSETEVEEITVSGANYLRAVAWLTENEWALVVRVAKANAYAPIRHARLVIVAVMVAALVFTVFLVLLITRRLINKLEEADITKEKLRRQLFNAAKLASVGEIAAGVAHEINNPLAIIYEEASMMKDILDPQFGQQLNIDDFRERLDAIKAETMRGRSITQKLMAFARQHEADPEPTDMNLLVGRVVQAREHDFIVSNISVVRQFAEGLPMVMANRNELEQVMLNLLNNAKHAIKGKGTVTVRTGLEGDTVCVEVEDTGCGMSPEVMEKIFFPFYTTKEVGKGTGLGLSISYGIVKSIKGSIEVRSEIGVGSAFTVKLPSVPRENGNATQKAKEVA